MREWRFLFLSQFRKNSVLFLGWKNLGSFGKGIQAPDITFFEEMYWHDTLASAIVLFTNCIRALTYCLRSWKWQQPLPTAFEWAVLMHKKDDQEFKLFWSYGRIAHCLTYLHEQSCYHLKTKLWLFLCKHTVCIEMLCSVFPKHISIKINSTTDCCNWRADSDIHSVPKICYISK